MTRSGFVGPPVSRSILTLAGLREAVAARPAATLALVLSVYGLLHVLVRVAISDSAELDEAEQVLLTQVWAWGYTLQPPLYTWLQRIAFAAFGLNVFSLALLKNALLCVTHACLFLAARRMLGAGDVAVGVSLSLWLLPQIAWESHRDLTHSVLVTALAAGTFHAVLRLLAGGRLGEYAAAGIVLGLGALAKHNFLVFAGALAAAVAADRPAARRLASRHLLVTLAVAGALVLPHAVWLAGQPPAEFVLGVEKLGVRDGGSWLVGVTTGVGRLGWATLRFLAPLGLVWALLFPRAFTRAAPTPVPGRRLLERFFAGSFAVLFFAVVALGVTHFKDRWMQPVLFLAPLYAFLRLPGGRPPADRLRPLAAVLAAVGLVVLVAPLGQAWIGPWLGVYSRLHLPHREVADEIRAAGFRGGTVLADDVLLGGNLRLAFPEARVLTPEVATAVLPRDGDGPCLVAWRPGRTGWEVARFRRLVADTLGAPLPPEAPVHVAVAPYRGSASRMYLIRYVLLPRGVGGCR